MYTNCKFSHRHIVVRQTLADKIVYMDIFHSVCNLKMCPHRISYYFPTDRKLKFIFLMETYIIPILPTNAFLLKDLLYPSFVDQIIRIFVPHKK